jgi:signal transduction histidine kinase/ActR/RegA family two-component response regulator
VCGRTRALWYDIRGRLSAVRGRMRRMIELLRQAADAGEHARLRVVLVLLGAIVIAAFTASSAYDGWRAYQHVIISTNREVQNLASALAEQTAWSWSECNLVMQRTARWYPEHMQLPPERIDEALAAAVSSVPQVDAMRIIDAHGIVRYTSDNTVPVGKDLAARSYFVAQQRSADDDLFLTQPLVTVSGRSAVVASRKILDAHGRFAGIVSAIVDFGDLSRLYSAVNLRGQFTVELMRSDGTLLVRRPIAPALIGRRLQVLPTLRPGTTFRIRDPMDGQREFIAVARVSSLPLLLAVTRSEDIALASVRQESIHDVIRTLLLVLLGSLTIAALVRQLRRVEQRDLALRQSQKMEAIGTLAGGIAHDFNNILGAIVGYGELAQQQAPEGSSLRRYLDNIMHAAGRARSLVDRILGFSRTGLTERVPIHVQAVVAETLELLQASLPPNVRLESELIAADCAIIGDETRLHQVTMNLCTNAVQAMPEGGVLRVTLEEVALSAPHRLRRGQLAVGDYARLTVSDSGKGVPSEIVDRIFDPFFTTKPVGEGTGLGLSLVHGIVADLGGAIEVSSAAGKGTTFRIWLPATCEPARAPAGESGALPRGRGETVLIVDDEPALMALSEEMLAELGYEPVGFESSVAALRAYKADPERFDVVLTDEVMPELAGTELARELGKVRPGVRILLMSGHGGAYFAERAGAAGVSDILRKPLRKKDLAESLASVLTGSRLPG